MFNRNTLGSTIIGAKISLIYWCPTVGILTIFLFSQCKDATKSTVDTTLAILEEPREKIEFTTNRDGNKEIYLLNLEIDSEVRLTNDQGEDVLPAISPNGKKIAFMSNRNQKNRSLNIIHFGTGERRQLTKTKNRNEDPSRQPSAQ